MINTKNLFITGKPASGKTTLIKESCLPFLSRVGGFYTEEMTEEGKLAGFELKTFGGERGVLALKGRKDPVKLNKYGIDLAVLDEVGVGALRVAMVQKDIIVIDEIGSMEILSDRFRETLMECLRSEKRVLATIRYNSQPFTDEVKNMKDTALLYLSRENFPEVKRQVRQWLFEANTHA